MFSGEKKGKGRYAQLVHSYRKNGKVKTRVLLHIGRKVITWKLAEEIEAKYPDIEFDWDKILAKHPKLDYRLGGLFYNANKAYIHEDMPKLYEIHEEVKQRYPTRADQIIEEMAYEEAKRREFLRSSGWGAFGTKLAKQLPQGEGA